MPSTAEAPPNPAGHHRPAVRPEDLVALRKDMLRFAQLQVRDAEVAEDIVQDAMEAALRNAGTFSGASTLKTWVFAILRNRTVDHFRSSDRTVIASSLVEESDEWQHRLEEIFSQRGFWRDETRPAAWPNPEQSMQTRQFWGVFEACLERLPHAGGRAFMMRELLGMETEEICAALGISQSNCYVLLHRARLKLQGCMDTGWGRAGVAG